MSSASDVPVVETDRLRLRGHTLDDFAHTRALWTDATVMQHMGGKPQTLEECWARLLRYAGHWPLLGFGYWLVEERETGEFVGEVGFADFKREIEPALGPIPELGWVLAPAKQGNGYATEAAQAALGWARKHFGSGNFACLINPENQASIKVAVKCGFEEKHMGMYKGRPVIVFKIHS
jgi:RimJ/RimL family protein N-acetyltransferase